MSAFVMCDTSSAIEMTSRGDRLFTRLYATPGIKNYNSQAFAKAFHPRYDEKLAGEKR